MPITNDFLTEEDELEIVEAIRTAEKNTSGEIRVHLEKKANKDPFERALDVFYDLGMDKTALRNGVLFYFALLDKSFVIYGDEGINTKVNTDFWNCTKDIILSHFKEKRYKQGIIAGILRAGEQLQSYFPSQDTNKNELSNEISKE